MNKPVSSTMKEAEASEELLPHGRETFSELGPAPSGLGRVADWLAGRPHAVFLVLALSFGLLYALVIPPTDNHDEAYHYLRVEQIMNGSAVPEMRPGEVDQKMVDGGGPVDSAAVAFRQYFLDRTQNQDRPKVPWLLHSNPPEHRTGEVEFVQNNPMSVYSPVLYLPQLAASAVSRTLGLDLSTEFLAMRLTGLVATSLLIALAIWLAPIGKWPITMVALFPAFVAQLSAISADGLVIAAVWLFVASLTRMISSPNRVRWWNWAGFVAGAVGIGWSKTPYLAVLGLGLLLPLLAKPFRQRAKLAGVGVVTVVSVGAGIWWYLQVRRIWVNWQDPSANVKWIIDHPIAFAKTELVSFLAQNNIGAMNYHSTFLGNSLSLNGFFLAAGVVAVALSFLVERSSFAASLGKGARLAQVSMLVLFVAEWALSLVALYIAHRIYRGEVGNTGWQGRYLLPVAPLLLLPLVSGLRPSPRGRRLVLGYCLGATVASLLAGAAAVVILL